METTTITGGINGEDALEWDIYLFIHQFTPLVAAQCSVDIILEDQLWFPESLWIVRWIGKVFKK